MTQSILEIIINTDTILPDSAPPDRFLRLKEETTLRISAGNFRVPKTLRILTYPGGEETLQLMGRARLTLNPTEFIEAFVPAHNDETPYIIQMEVDIDHNRPINGYIKVVKTW